MILRVSLSPARSLSPIGLLSTVGPNCGDLQYGDGATLSITKIDALFVICLFIEFLGNAPNGALTSPKSLGRIASQSIGYSIMVTQ